MGIRCAHMSPATASAVEPIHDRLAPFDAERVPGRRGLAGAIRSRTVGRLEHPEYSPSPDAAWVWRRSPRWWAPRATAWVLAYPRTHGRGSVGPGIRGHGSADVVIEIASHGGTEVAALGSTEVPERTDD